MGNERDARASGGEMKLLGKRYCENCLKEGLQ